MKTLSIAAAAALTTAAAPVPAPAAPEPVMPGYSEPAHPWRDIGDAQATTEARAGCRDTITRARAASGHPPLDRGVAHSGDATMFYAVDRSVDGCDVLVPVSDPAGIQPLPPAGGTPKMQPATPNG